MVAVATREHAPHLLRSPTSHTPPPPPTFPPTLPFPPPPLPAPLPPPPPTATACRWCRPPGLCPGPGPLRAAIPTAAAALQTRSAATAGTRNKEGGRKAARHESQATSHKSQATSHTLQATSHKSQVTCHSQRTRGRARGQNPLRPHAALGVHKLNLDVVPAALQLPVSTQIPQRREKRNKINKKKGKNKEKNKKESEENKVLSVLETRTTNWSNARKNEGRWVKEGVMGGSRRYSTALDTVVLHCTLQYCTVL